MQPLEVPTRLWEEVGANLITQLPYSNGYDAILVCTDLFGKQIHVIPCTTNISAEHQEKYFFPWQTRQPGGHSPQSSGISGNLGLHEVYQGAQALQGTPGFPRVTEAL